MAKQAPKPEAAYLPDDWRRRRTSRCRMCNAFEKGLGIKASPFPNRSPTQSPKPFHSWQPWGPADEMFKFAWNLGETGKYSVLERRSRVPAIERYLKTRRTPECYACKIFDIGFIESPVDVEPSQDRRLWEQQVKQHKLKRGTFAYNMYSEGLNAGIDATRRDKDMRKPRRELTDEEKKKRAEELLEQLRLNRLEGL
jgi:hypothetical protein